MVMLLSHTDTKDKVSKFLKGMIDANVLCFIDCNIVHATFELLIKGGDADPDSYWQVQVAKIEDSWITVETQDFIPDVRFWDTEEKAMTYFEICYNKAVKEVDELHEDVFYTFDVKRGIISKNELPSNEIDFAL